MTTASTRRQTCDGGQIRPAPPLPEPHPEAVTTTVRRVDSRELLGTADEIEIAHRSYIYRLRRTSMGKLILTK